MRKLNQPKQPHIQKALDHAKKMKEHVKKYNLAKKYGAQLSPDGKLIRVSASPE
jgi:hypothetical protein